MDEATARPAGSPGGEGDLERRNRELSVLNGIARELNRSVDPDQALRFVLSQVAELLGLRTGGGWRVGDDPPRGRAARRTRTRRPGSSSRGSRSCLACGPAGSG